ncbi:MAG: PAS domain-containing protein [Pseudomonadota bacterium]
MKTMIEDVDVKDKENILEIKSAAAAERGHELSAFIDYWQNMRRGQDVPLRTEIDPRGFESLLSNSFIAEKVTPGLARMRVAGAELSKLLGMEIRGMPISSLIDADDQTRLSDAIVDLFERPAIVQIELISRDRFDTQPLQGTMVILPLRSDLGDISRALGCLVTSGEIGEGPRRFKIRDIQLRKIDIPQNSKALQFSEAQTLLTGPGKSNDGDRRLYRSERPYLKLVHSS